MIVVGGGSILVNGPIGGLEVVKPNHFAVANAVGAAIAQVSGEVDRVYALAEIGREQALTTPRAARDRSGGGRRRGARQHRDRRRRGRAARLPAGQCHARPRQGRGRAPCRLRATSSKEADLLPLSIGAALLGTGGGGNPYIGMLRTRELFRKGASVRVVPLDALPDDAWVGEVGGIGAPVVGVEKIEEGGECYRAMRAVEEAAGVKMSALISAEIGGANAMEPIIAAAHGGSAGGRRRRHGPRLSGSADDDVLHLRRTSRRWRRSPTRRAMSWSSKHVIDMFWLERFARHVVVDMGAARRLRRRADADGVRAPRGGARHRHAGAENRRHRARRAREATERRRTRGRRRAAQAVLHRQDHRHRARADRRLRARPGAVAGSTNGRDPKGASPSRTRTWCCGSTASR